MQVQGLLSVLPGKGQMCMSHFSAGMLHRAKECDFCFAQVPTEPPKSHSNVHPNYSSEGNEMTNDVQRDQSASSLQDKTAPDIATTAASTSTHPPFISLPVTKSPGKTCHSNMSLCTCVCVCTYVCALFIYQVI